MTYPSYLVKLVHKWTTWVNVRAPTYFALYWLGSLHLDNHTKSESPVAVLTRWKGSKTSHIANSIRYTVNISLIKYTLSSSSLCVQARCWAEEGETEGRQGLVGRVMATFYHSSQGRHRVALNTDRDLRRYDLLAKKCPKDRRAISSAVPGTAWRKW